VARAGYLDNLSAGAVALEATLTAIKGAGWTTETLKAIRDAIATAQADLDNPNQYKADVSALALASVCTEDRLSKLDAAISSRLAAASYTPERGTDNAALASVCTETRLARLDATISSRKPAKYYVSDDLLLSSDAEVSTNSTTATEKRENSLVEGNFRIAFDLKAENASWAAGGQIYKNGATIGTLRSTTSTTYVTYSEDINSWVDNDLEQLYIKTSYNVYLAYARNFRTYGKFPVMAVIL